MENFADYILEEKDLASKMEIVYYLAKKTRIFFDKSVIFKTELTRMFLNYSKIEVDKNLVLTASLLCNIKKVDNAQDIESIHTYAKKGAEYLATIGFSKRFCKICGGMLLDRPERIGFKPDEALVLLEYRNLKDEYNRYLETFMQFVNFMESIDMSELVNMSAIKRLVKIHNESKDIVSFIKEVVYSYEPKVDKMIEKEMEKQSKEMFSKVNDPNRPLFSEETAKKIMSHVADEKLKEGVENN